MSEKKPKDKAEAAASTPAPNRIAEVDMDVSIEIGRRRVSIETLLEWREGSLLELDKVSGDAVDVRVNGEPFAKGEVIVIMENYGVRLTEILDREEVSA